MAGWSLERSRRLRSPRRSCARRRRHPGGPRSTSSRSRSSSCRTRWRAGAITSRQLVEQYLARIEPYDQRGPQLNAFISLNPKALDEAGRARRRAERRPDARAAARHSDRRSKTTTPPSDLPTTGGLAGAAGIRGRARRVHGAEAARGRRGHHRQDEPARAGLRHHVDQLDGRADAQSRTIRRATPAARAAAPARRLRPASPPPAWAPTRADRSAFRRRTTTCSACAARAACRAATASSRCRTRRTSADRSRASVADLDPDARRHGRLRSRRPGHERQRRHGSRAPTWPASATARWATSTSAILTPLFGTAPEDGEVGAIVRKAVADLGDLGARVSEIAPDGIRRAAAGDERHQRRVQVRPARLPRKLPRPEARAIARRDPDERPVSHRGRRRAAARRTRSNRETPRRTAPRWRSARPRPRAIADLLRPAQHHRARLSDAAPETGAGRRGAGGLELSAQCDDRPSGDQHPGRLHCRTGFQSGSNCWARRSANRRCCASPMPTSRRAAPPSSARQHAAIR